MPFKPTAHRPEEPVTGASSGIVCPGKIADRIGFHPNGAWLFAYMFRRFGPPNSYSDDHKNLASWCLTTPKKGCYLSVTPYLGDKGNPEQSTLSFGYRLSEPLQTAAQTAPPDVRRAWKQWKKKVLRWADKKKVSIVADDQLDRRKPLNQYGYGAPGEPQRWLVWTNKADKDRPVELNMRLLKSMPMWMAADLGTAYRKRHPKAKRPPHPYENPRVIGHIEAALEKTLRELMRPIYVRDIAFDPNGRENGDEFTGSPAEPYEHAGYPCAPVLPKKSKKKKKK